MLRESSPTFMPIICKNNLFQNISYILVAPHNRKDMHKDKNIFMYIEFKVF